MQAPAEKIAPAWQPLTPRGVAAFAEASFGRLWFVQLVVSLLVAGVVVWFVHASWFPVVRSAIQSLPEQGQVRSAQLDWRGDTVQPLAENRFLAITIDLNHQGAARSPAHVQLELGRVDWRVLTLFGTLVQDYPSDQIFAFNRIELVPWWGAWAPELLALIAVGVIIWLFLSWTLLASLYFIPVRLLAFFSDRPLTFGGSWRLAGAALMPGALWMTGTLYVYGRGALSLLELALLFAAHFVAGWVYLLLSVLSIPRELHSAHNLNPFVPAVLPKSEQSEQPGVRTSGSS